MCGLGLLMQGKSYFLGSLDYSILCLLLDLYLLDTWFVIIFLSSLIDLENLSLFEVFLLIYIISRSILTFFKSLITK